MILAFKCVPYNMNTRIVLSISKIHSLSSRINILISEIHVFKYGIHSQNILVTWQLCRFTAMAAAVA